MFRTTILSALACVLLAVAAATAPLGAAEPSTGFVDKVYKGADGKESKYVVFVPPSYKGDTELPVILFLHGAGSKGTDGKKQMGGGLSRAIRANEKDFAF